MPGIGIDVEEIARWREPGRKLEKLFTDEELAHAHRRSDPAPTLAGLWCAKEAVFKAISGSVDDVWLRSISIRHNDAGAPSAHVAGHPELEGRILLSISHSGQTATAVAHLL